MNAAVHVEERGPVTVVTLDRPEVRNAVDSDTARALHQAFLVFEANPEARVAVFHGANGHFCAGWDLQFGARMAQREDGAAVLSHLEFSAGDRKPLGPMGPSRLLLAKPVIAAVSGAAVAGGMELANRVVPRGSAREAAIALAQQLAKFPQQTMLADRMNAYEQWDLPLAQALQLEWERGKHRIGGGLEGAGRFAAGEGRHGKF